MYMYIAASRIPQYLLQKSNMIRSDSQKIKNALIQFGSIAYTGSNLKTDLQCLVRHYTTTICIYTNLLTVLVVVEYVLHAVMGN